MLKNTIVYSEYFWKALHFLETVQEDYIDVEEFQKTFSLSEERLLEFVSYINLFDYNAKFEKKLDGRRLIKLPNPRPSITLKLSFSQWLGIQTKLPKITSIFKDSAPTIFKSLEDKIIDINKDYPQYNFFEVIEREREKQKVFFKICNQKRSILEKVEDALSNNLCLAVDVKDNKPVEIYIHQIVFLDGGLSVVAEDINEKCLIYFDLVSIENIRLSFNDDYKPTYSGFEINDFITSVRSVIGKEDRLVLKIKNQDKVSLSPQYHFLGNPFITSNMNGEVIWAASVERSEELYRWLDEIFDYIEILDPQNLVSDYYKYRSSRTDLKKAS